VPRFVAIVAPHTSNWDFVIGVFVMFALDLRILWLGKDSLFATPLGPVLRAMGGRPVNRSAAEGTVGDIASTLMAEPKFIVALAPEGTRRPVPQWRTGFYRIAQATGAPILPVWMDWSRREVGLGEPLAPSGSLERDVLALQALYHARMGRYPANYVARG
jgi:1-acyl-sn-glycerol-3-phosphate acyltransferase